MASRARDEEVGGEKRISTDYKFSTGEVAPGRSGSSLHARIYFRLLNMFKSIATTTWANTTDTDILR